MPGQLPGRELLLEPEEDAHPLEPGQPGSGQPRENDEGQGRPQADPLAELDQQHQLDDRHDHEEEGEAPEKVHAKLYLLPGIGVPAPTGHA